MDRTRFSFLAHRSLPFCAPVSEERVDRAIASLELGLGATVVDFGAGKCEWLIRIIRRFGVQGIGVEPAGPFAEEARRRGRERVEEGRLQVVEQSAAEFLEARRGERFDAALCIGSSHAFGNYTKTLTVLSPLLTPGGVMIIGEGYWKRAPDPDYLAVMGGTEAEFTSHAGNIQAAIAQGLTPLWATTSTDDEWDEYEWAYSRGIESFVREHPDDPDAAAMLARSRSWRDAVVRWGRDTLGFGLYSFRVG
jgi:ubiquinone/menaquinone biosynthesis C-methylase UbiE